MCAMCRRRIRTHAEWNVATSGARIPAGASSASTRRAISPAALLVNVTASTRLGSTPRTPRSQAIRWAMTRVLPLPAPASTRSGPSPAVTASRCGGFSSERSASRSSTQQLYPSHVRDGARCVLLLHADADLVIVLDACDLPAVGLDGPAGIALCLRRRAARVQEVHGG